MRITKIEKGTGHEDNAPNLNRRDLIKLEETDITTHEIQQRHLLSTFIFIIRKLFHFATLPFSILWKIVTSPFSIGWKIVTLPLSIGWKIVTLPFSIGWKIFVKLPLKIFWKIFRLLI